jgi:hypothetical protein
MKFKALIATLAAVLGSALMVLVPAAPASASAGLNVNIYGQWVDSTHVVILGNASCTGGGSATVTVVYEQSVLNLGVGVSGSVACDGSVHNWSAPVTATSGTFADFGSGTAAGILLDASNNQLAEATATTQVM